MRLQADFENYRKRAAAQHADDVDRATGRLAEALLPVLDACEAAYVQHPDEIGPLLIAVARPSCRSTVSKRSTCTASRSIPRSPTPCPRAGRRRRRCVVAEVLRSGYRWQGRMLRPAMVRTDRLRRSARREDRSRR